MLLDSGFDILPSGRSAVAAEAMVGNEDWLNLVFDCINFPRKEVYESAAAVLGRLLYAMRKHPDHSINTISLSKFSARLESVLSSKLLRDDGPPAVSCCLRRICEKDSLFLTREMLLKILSVFSHLQSKGRIDVMEILRCVDDRMNKELPTISILEPYLPSCLSDLFCVTEGRGSASFKLPMLQINTVLLLLKHVETLDLRLIDMLLGQSASEGLRLITNPKTVLRSREAGYQLLMNLYNSNCNLTINAIESSCDGEYANTLRKRVSLMLLGGLADPDDEGMEDRRVGKSSSSNGTTIHHVATGSGAKSDVARIGIRKQLFDFFSESSALSDSLPMRLQTLMTDFQDVSLSDQWLQYTSYLLVRVCSDSEKTRTSPLFKGSLAPDDQYQPMKVMADREY